jgi:hypothetical protein
MFRQLHLGWIIWSTSRRRASSTSGFAAPGVHGANDSCWGGVDCVVITPHHVSNAMDLFAWQGQAVTVETTGIHTVSVWGREDGFKLDKIMINKSAELPSDTGPDESPRQ